MQITGVGSRRVIQIGAIIAIFFGLIGKHLWTVLVMGAFSPMGGCFRLPSAGWCERRLVGNAGKIGGLFASMPQALVAGLFCVMFALIGELSETTLALSCCITWKPSV